MNRKLQAYFDNKLTQQEELEIQIWLAEQGDSAEANAQMERLFNSVEIHDNELAHAAFERVSQRLGLPAQQKPTRTGWGWAQRIAAVLFVPLLITAWLLATNRPSDVQWIERQIPSGEVAEINLPDGSHMHLNAGSRITYPSKFTGKERRVFIDGEVFAEIAKDRRKPFVIQSGEIGIKVLGTTFNFKSYNNTECIEVLLIEGAVQFDVNSQTRTQQLVMKPGDMVQYDRTTGDIDLSRFSPDHFKSFADNRAIHFFNLRMRDIATDLERLFDTQIVVLDEQLANARYFAYFTNNESLDQILASINANRKMQILKRDGVIYLSSRK